MSYDIYLTDPRTDAPVEFAEPHSIQGGTYAVNGTSKAWLNVTYNYGPIFRRVFGENGIRTIYGMTAEASLPVLTAAADKLTGERDTDYWAPTDGNAKAAILNLARLAELAPPDSVWSGD